MFRSPWLLLLLTFAMATPGQAAEPAIARPGLAGAGASAAEGRGLVFFLQVSTEPGVAAVGTAHTYPLDRIVEAGQVDFFLGGSLTQVGSSQRFLTEPGRPFSLPEATIRGDFMVFALDAAPSGARALVADAGLPEPGARVRILGVPEKKGRNEDDIYGRVDQVSPGRLEIALDVPQSLRGWGGAPILDVRSNRVIGLLEAHLPGDATTSLIAAPIGGVVEALATPLEAGVGRPFASFGDLDPDAALLAGGHARDAPFDSDAERRRLLSQGEEQPTSVLLEVEYPPAGSVVSRSACGVFVSGRALATRGDVRSFDVIMVIDTSRSTVDPTGNDINGNGTVGTRRLGGIGAIFGSGSTDPGDSILAAEVAAARQLLRGLDSRSTRVGLVVFAGDPSGGGWGSGGPRPAFTLEPLSQDYTRIERSLDYLLQTDPEGSTHMAAGVDQATIELLGLRGAISRPNPNADKVV